MAIENDKGNEIDRFLHGTQIDRENTKIEKEIRKFLNGICKRFGICDPLYDLEYFVSKEHYNVDDFVREVFLSEGLDPDVYLKLFRQVKKMFTDQFGAEINRY